MKILYVTNHNRIAMASGGFISMTTKMILYSTVYESYMGMM
jgi:hypothetical protein